jgi:tetratricopeptide (TPR) repeat protein
VEMAAEVEPNSTLLFSEMARLHLMCGAARQANRYLSPRAVAACPSGEDPRDVTELIERQIENIRSVLRKHPNHADLHYRLGLLLRQKGDLEGAIGAYREAIGINPDYGSAVIKLGLALKEAGRDEAAVDCLKRALQVDPESIDVHYQLGLLFADRGEFLSALKSFGEAIKGDPRNVDFHAHLALALQNMGLLDRADACWQTLCAVAAHSEKGRSLLGQIGGL